MEATIEELSLNAWPAIRQVHFDNWVLRFSGGHTRRSNSVNILGPSTLPLDFKIGFCEEAYSRLNSPTVFKFSDIPGNELIEEMLESSGYTTEGNAIVMTRDLRSLGPIPTAEFRVESELTEEWFELASALTAIERSRKPFLAQILSNIVPNRGFGSILVDGQAVAIGLGVVERNWLGVFDVVTAPEFRRQGFGSRLMLNLMRWGKTLGAQDAYLQVVKNNDPAIQLYDGLGFDSQYEYWYRVKQLPA